MRWLGCLVLALLAAAIPAAAADGLVTKKSAYSVAETLDRLERAARERDLVVVARIDHGAAAQRVGLPLRPTELLIFGNPQVGTALMQSRQSAGLDLPLKALAWQDESGQVWLTYGDPADLATRHAITDRGDVVRAIAGALDRLTDAATKAGP